MSIETSEASERVLALERKLYRIRAALDDMVIWRVPTLEQGIAMVWARGPRRQSQVIGEVDGCASAGFPGAEVLVRDSAGKRLGSGVAKSDGKYKVWCNLASDPQDVDIVATPAGTYAARFDGPVVTPATLSVGANAVDPIVIPPTEDWCCGETDYFPGDCATCDLDLTVVGCNSLGVPGATITVTRVSDSAVLSTGTTGSTGHYIDSFSLGGPSVPVDIAIDSPNTDRLNSQVYSTTLTTGAAPITRTLAITNTSLWVCQSGKWYPIPTVLHLTDSVLGSVTLTWNSGLNRYNGTRSLSSFPGCGSCPPTVGSYTVSYRLAGNTLTAEHVGSGSGACCPNVPSFLCGDGFGAMGSIPALPPYSSTRTAVDFGAWHCGASVTYTITE